MKKENKIFRLPRRAKGSPRNDKGGFTLVEIVIATAIIGTLSALTIQTYFINSNTQKAQYIAGLKKAYSELSYATDQIKAKNGGTMVGAWTGTPMDRSDKFRDLYLNYLKATMLCDASNFDKTKCWAPPFEYFNFAGTAPTFVVDMYSIAVLNDGMFVVFRSYDGTLPPDFKDIACDDPMVGPMPPGTGCGEMYVDVNGFKNPNRFGKDIFKFYLSKDKIIPCGDTFTGEDPAVTGVNCPSSDWNNNGGLQCTSKILNDGKMLY